MNVAKNLWASVQGDPVFMRRVNGWLTMFWLAIQPRSLSAARNGAATPVSVSGATSTLSTPTRLTLPACCPSAASGAARRPPARLATNARRFIILSPDPPGAGAGWLADR